MESLSRSSECPSEEELWLHFAGSLSESRQKRMADHLKHCTACSSLATPEAFGASATIIDDRYKLGESLGQGASAVVRAAHDEKLGIDVALKLFMGGNTKRVLQELVVARKINHPNVCRMYDFGEVPGALYLSMELVKGGTLADRFAQRPGPTTEASKILAQIVDGLEAAHQAGVVHRDLKPQNILIEHGERIVITDFGLARLIDSEESRAQLVGTPAYWSPEQARGEPATCASDVYSLGVIAYRLFTGKSFSMSNPSALKAVPKRYRAVVRRCLSPAPSERYRNATEVKEALRAQSFGKSMAFGLAALALLGFGALGVRALGSRSTSPEPVATVGADFVRTAPPSSATLPALTVLPTDTVPVPVPAPVPVTVPSPSHAAHGAETIVPSRDGRPERKPGVAHGGASSAPAIPPVPSVAAPKPTATSNLLFGQ